MARAVLLLEVRPVGDGRSEVVSPGIGWWCDHPPAGALVGPGTVVGVLEVQNQRIRLVMPEGAAGRVSGPLPRDRRIAVEHGETLFRLVAVAAGETVGFDGVSTAPGQALGTDVPDGTRAVRAPTDGVFYTRPAPDAEPFVTVGGTVVSGQPIGLIEVMKTFNQIHYGGAGFPERATVVEVRVGDGVDVRAGETLVVVR